ncbi:hypothetical protein CPB86DRAFT_871942 [Serendipita vermifera]|nr:hypothetical protein CPB86DRAFT_871942 [Serendipita vermifera]
MDDGDVNNLEKRLKDATMHQVVLQWELERILENDTLFYRDKGIGIHSLPVEVLGNILYESLLLPKARPLGHFMGVCRRWQHVILNTPLLWSVIHIDVPSSLDKAEACLTYCQSCVERSGSCLLDISVNLPRSESGDWAFTETHGSRRTIWDGDTWYNGLLTRAAYGKLPTRLERLYLHQNRQEQTLRTFVGNKGEVMARWRKFNAIYSRGGHNAIIEMLERSEFGYPTPFLESLVFYGIRTPDAFPYLGDNNYPYRPPTNNGSPINFPHMPNIRTIQWWGMEVLVHKQVTNPISIQELACACKSHDSLRFVLALNHLTHLQIAFSNITSTGPDLGRNTITFPHLRYMQITQSVIPPLWTLLEAPELGLIVLDDLVEGLHNLSPISIKNLFPSLRRITIYQRWGTFYRDFFMFLHELIRHAPSLASISSDRRRDLVRDLENHRCETVHLGHTSRGTVGDEHSTPRSTLDIISILEDSRGDNPSERLVHDVQRVDGIEGGEGSPLS